jgi:hypothetical protein
LRVPIILVPGLADHGVVLHRHKLVLLVMLNQIVAYDIGWLPLANRPFDPVLILTFVG